jgi:hypothetical protein
MDRSILAPALCLSLGLADLVCSCTVDQKHDNFLRQTSPLAATMLPTISLVALCALAFVSGHPIRALTSFILMHV